MKKNIFLLPLMLTLLVSYSSTLSADQLDGLWRNDRENITVRIEHVQDGFRAKRTDQGIWYNYKLDDGAYIDKRGNWYEVIHEDQIQWTDITSRKRILFNRVESRNNNSWSGRDRHDEWDTDYGPRDRREEIEQRRSAIAGRWYDRSSKERMIIEETNNGYRVRTQHGTWEKFNADRNGQRLRSRSGDIIQMVDRNTLRYRSRQDNSERIFLRQGNGHTKGNGKGQVRENGHRHEKVKHGNSGKKSCG